MHKRSHFLLIIALFALTGFTVAGCGSGDEEVEVVTPADLGLEASEGEGEAMEEEGTEEEGGSGEEAETVDVDLDAGRGLFTEVCGSCHTLDDAGTEGAVGPDLSGGGYDAETVADIIANGQGAMPSGLASGDDADTIAGYVAAVTQ